MYNVDLLIRSFVVKIIWFLLIVFVNTETGINYIKIIYIYNQI